ncbi:MAG: MYG1 family protein [bacterium]
MIKIVTHDAKFHTDDVFAVATLFLAFGKENCNVVRTRDEEIIHQSDIVVDVGGEYNVVTKKFDHHQSGGAGARENGISYASFGLVWKEYGEKISDSKEVSEEIERVLIQPIDALDNGESISSPLIPHLHQFDINNVINLYRSTWKEKRDWDESFVEAVDWATWVLTRLIKTTKDILEAKEIVIRAYETAKDKNIIVIDKKYDVGREVVMDVLFSYVEPIYAVLYRSDAKNWQVVAIRKEEGSFSSRKSFPESWKALRDEELQKITGVKDSLFCHRSGFMCIVGSQEGAEKLAKSALENCKIEN